MSRCGAVCVVSALLTIACVREPGAQAGAYAGRSPSAQNPPCYHLELGPWVPSMSNDAWLPVPPDVIVLTGTPVPRAVATRSFSFDGPYEVRPSNVLFSEWRSTAPDTMELTWGTGFVGVRYRLHGSEGTLAGRAETFDDSESPAHVAAVRATRVACPRTLTAQEPPNDALQRTKPAQAMELRR
jgi:hypothetical protein